MTKAVFLDADTVASAQPVKPSCCSDWETYDNTSSSQTAERIADADVIITNKVRISADEFAAANKLKLIVVAATGYDIIDLAAAKKHDVAVANSPGYSASSVPEHALGLMFAVARSIVPFAAAASDGTWQQASTFCLHNHPIVELRGMTVGLVGSGSLGQATGKLCEALGMNTIYNARAEARDDSLTRLPFADLLAQADIVSLHCPLTDQNHHLFDAQAFKLMKNSAFLINTARGGLVDPAALVQALQTGQIAGAGIDVLETEPPQAGHPLLSCKHPGLVVTPHIAWASVQVQRRLMKLVAATTDAFFAGTPQHLVG